MNLGINFPPRNNKDWFVSLLGFSFLMIALGFISLNPVVNMYWIVLVLAVISMAGAAYFLFKEKNRLSQLEKLSA